MLVLHLRFRKRLTVEVSSVALWRDLERPGLGTRGVRTLRDKLALALLVLALTLLAGALAGPSTGAPADDARRLVVVLDESASMTAVDSTRAEEGSRFVQARIAASSAIRKLGPSDEVCVWLASDAPRVLVEPTTDKLAARAALEGARPTLRGPGLVRAVQLAARAAGRPGAAETTLLVLTDHAGAETLAEAPPVDADVRVGALGNPDARNASVSVRLVSDPDDRLLVRFETTDGAPLPRRAVLTRDGDLVDEILLTPGDDGSAEARIGLGDIATGGVMEVRLEPPDDLAEDDSARILLPAREPLTVLVTAESGSPSPYLVEALRSMPSIVDGRGARLGRPDADPTAFLGVDVLIADGARPERLPRPIARVEFLSAGDRETERPLLWGTGDHPVLRGVDLSPLRVDKAVLLLPSPRETPLIETAEGVVALAGEQGGVRYVVFGFRPGASTLPLEAAFPLLVRNALRWLGTEPVLPGAIASSRRVPLRTPAEPGATLRLEGPRAGEVTLLRHEDGVVTTPAPLPDPAGPYAVSIEGAGRLGHTLLTWLPPPGFRLEPLAATEVAGGGDAVASLPDRRSNVDTRQRHGAWLAGFAALALLLGAALLQGGKEDAPKVRVQDVSATQLLVATNVVGSTYSQAGKLDRPRKPD